MSIAHFCLFYYFLITLVVTNSVANSPILEKVAAVAATIGGPASLSTADHNFLGKTCSIILF